MTSTRESGELPLPVVEAGPEALMRLGPVHTDGRTVRASMPLGPWAAGSEGRTTAGSLGVLVDNVLGYAIIAQRPADHWSVSTEISLDVFGGLRSATGRLHAQARVVHVDGIGGFATGKVFDDARDLVAVCSQRGRFVPAVPGEMNGGQDFSTLPRDAVDVAALIHAQRRVRDGCCELDLHVSPALQNPMHNLHGGISLCASDLAASITQETSPRPLTTASIHVVYARPVPGGALATFAATLRHGGRSLGLVDVVGSVDGMRCTVAQVTLQSAG